MINWKQGRPVNKISNFYKTLKNLVEKNSNSQHAIELTSLCLGG